MMGATTGRVGGTDTATASNATTTTVVPDAISASSSSSVSEQSGSHDGTTTKQQQQAANTTGSQIVLDGQRRQVPSRNQVLRRLSEALMRQTLTMIDMSQRGLQASDARLLKLALLQNAQLSVLKLGYNNLGDYGMSILSEAVQNHEALRTLDVGFNQIGDRGCQAIAAALTGPSSCLHTLYLAGNSIGESGALALAAMIKGGQSRHLKRLHLTANRIGDRGVQAIAEAVIFSGQSMEGRKECNSPSVLSGSAGTLTSSEGKEADNDEDDCNDGMRELFIGGSGMSMEGCQAVSDMIASNSSLRVLSLSDNNIGDAEAAVLSKALSANKDEFALEALQLSFNKLTCVGVESLMNSVWGSKTLKEVRLDNNKIGDRGAQLVAVVLTSTDLEILDIGFNNITSVGMKALMKLIAENKSLKSLSISGNRLDTVGSKAVAFALAYNRSLRSVFIDKCSMGYAAQRQIAAGIVSNSGTCLQIVTGFRLGVITVSLGLPPSLENWTNEQVLKFIHLMWERMRHEEEDKAMQEVDPLDFLPTRDNPLMANGEGMSKIADKVGPLDPATVVAVARRAFASLGNAQHEVHSLPSYRDPCFDSPLVDDDAIMMEVSADGIVRAIEPFEAEHKSQMKGMNEISFRPSDVASEIAPSFSGDFTLHNNDEKSSGSSSPVHNFSQRELDPERKRRNVDWLCRHIRNLNQLAHQSFSSSELWRLHQHFFSPVSQPDLLRDDFSNTEESDESSSAESNSLPALELPGSETILTDASIPAHEEGSNREACSLPILRRKESFQVLSDAVAQSYYEPRPTGKQGRSRPISVMIEENTSCHSLQHRKKRAKRPKAKIAYFPRIKDKLERLLETDHNLALTFMRQLLYVEHILFSDSIEFSDEGAISKQTGACTIDAELILVDLM
mmetsp:Transcript_6180/g.9002  ORF Transcript_6180/g.9002 Transcript_6180/m.9002 type:complete len:904 (-) Transcript_6180:232-2943(-)